MREANTEKLLIPGDIIKYNTDNKKGYKILDKDNNIMDIDKCHWYNGGCTVYIDCFSIYDGILWEKEFNISVNLKDTSRYSIHLEDNDNSRHIITSEKNYKNKHREYTIYYSIDFTELVKESGLHGFKIHDVIKFLENNKFYVKFSKFENNVYIYTISENWYSYGEDIMDPYKSPYTIFDFDEIKEGVEYLVKLDKFDKCKWEWSSESDDGRKHTLTFTDDNRRKFIVDMNNLFGDKSDNVRYQLEIIKKNIYLVPLIINVIKIHSNNTFVCKYGYSSDELELFNKLLIWPRLCWCLNYPEHINKVEESWKKRVENLDTYTNSILLHNNITHTRN